MLLTTVKRACRSDFQNALDRLKQDSILHPNRNLRAADTTHPIGGFKFSNRHSRAFEAYDLMWVDKARNDLYMGTVNSAGAVRGGVCEHLKCFDHRQFGSNPSRIVQ